jgi:hypothetical protein
MQFYLPYFERIGILSPILKSGILPPYFERIGISPHIF